MKKILKCKSFSSSIEFEKFQNENDVDICSITPIVSEINFSTVEYGSDACNTGGNT